MVLEDPKTGNSIKMDIENAEAMSGIQSNILCMGKMVKLGWHFQFGDYGNIMEATQPGGAHTFKVDLGSDDILRLPHNIRQGQDSAPLPVIPASINALRRTAPNAVYRFMHATFNQCGEEKLYQTLIHTSGYKPEKFESEHCNTCAQAKVRNFGLKHGTCNAEINLALSQFTGEQCAWLQAVLQSELQRCHEKEL